MSIYKMIEKKKKAQKRKEKTKIAKIAGATAVAGTTLGVVAGVLFAPKSGRETRADIAEKTVKAKNDVVVKSKKLKDNFVTKVGESKEDLLVAKGKIKEYLAAKKTNKEVIDEVSGLEEDIIEETEETLE